MPKSSTSSGRHSKHACTPERVAELVQQGKGRNEISRILKANVYQVNKAAEAAGVKFDREATRAATAARVADAQAEREELAEKFRYVSHTILSKIINSDPGDLDPADLRDLLWSAGSAAATDARYGRLMMDERLRAAELDENSEAKEQFGKLLDSVREGFRTLDDEDEAELQLEVEARDAAYFAEMEEGED